MPLQKLQLNPIPNFCNRFRLYWILNIKYLKYSDCIQISADFWLCLQILTLFKAPQKHSHSYDKHVMGL